MFAKVLIFILNAANNNVINGLIQLNIAYINRARAKTFSINCNPPESVNKEGAVLDYTAAIKLDPKDILS